SSAPPRKIPRLSPEGQVSWKASSTSWQPLSFSPRHSGKDAAPNPDERSGVATILDMMRLQQILPGHGEFDLFHNVPGNPRIRGSVTSDALRRQGCDVAESLAEFHSSREVKVRLESYLVARARSLVGTYGSHIGAARSVFQ